jgi:hypothetical protein
MSRSGSTDDMRAAASLTTALSSYLITAALAVLGADAIVATFVIDKRQHLIAFFVVNAVGLVALVFSIIFGGRGIYEIVKSGYEGEWRIKTRHRDFNCQAILVLLGTILVVVSSLLGCPKFSA